ncbi:MAG: murein biosynthesis integral membrane protein MurJ [Opitutaceae bacterium]|nr:murein biosynthesis integral membrane protein MurJ [Opitutaceae bacterium]
MLSRIGLVSAMTLMSRVFGLFRDILVTAVFGTSLLNSAFATAFTLPNLFRRLLGEGTLSAALMPHLSEELEEDGKEAVFRLINKTLSWLVIVCLLVIGVAYVGFEYIERNWVSSEWILTAGIAKLVFPYILFICLAAVVSAGLNLLGRFAIPAMTAVWLNCSILILLGIGGWLWGEGAREKMNFLCGGVMIGGALQLIAPSVALMREGWRPRLDYSVSTRLKAVLFLTLPGIYGTAAHQINIMVSRVLALDFNDSGAALINLANRLVELPMGVFVIAISTVVFPALAKASASGRNEDFSVTYRNGISLSMMMALPAAVGLSILAPEIIATLFEHGEFTESDTADLVPILIICAIGMPFYSFVSIEVRAYYSLKDVKTPVKSSTIALVLNLALSITLLRWLNRIEALVIASNVAVVLQATYLHFGLRSKGINLRLRLVLPTIFKFICGSVVMGIVLWFGKWGLEQFDFGIWRSSVYLVILIPLGALVYFVFLKALGLREIEEVLTAIRKKRRN